MIRIIRGDTHLTKNSGSTSATRQTYFTGNAVKEAAEGLLSNIYHYASIHFVTNHVDLDIENGYIFRKDNPDNKLSYWELAKKVKQKEKA